MNGVVKQPSVKLIPSDPMTNTILIIYCVSSTGASVPYKALWRKISPKRGKVEDIKAHNASSYRCSPLDLDSVIEVTVLFHFQGAQIQRVVQSNLVKVSRELKERRAYVKEPLPCKISIDEMPIEARVLFQDGVLFIFPGNAVGGEGSFALHSNDFVPEADANQHLFRIYLRSSFEEFMGFFANLLGWRPVIKSQVFLFTFASDINRDIVLLGLAEVFQRSSDLAQITLPKFIQPHGELDKSGHAKNRSQTTLSPAGKEKIKIAERVQMKKSQTGQKDAMPRELPIKESKIEPKVETKGNSFFRENGERRPEVASPTAKHPKEKPQEPREYLNVFESDEEDLLTPLPRPKEEPVREVKEGGLSQMKSPQQELQNQPSINLRGSFEELERSFSNNNEEAFDKVFGTIEANKKTEAELTRLRKENEELRRQAEQAASLAKENLQIKKKYHELKEEVNRLEMERKVILTDKLRCEVNWHKETQEKEYLKKELDSLRELLKGGLPFPERTKTASIHEGAKTANIHEGPKTTHEMATDRQKERNRSPNSSFYNK